MLNTFWVHSQHFTLLIGSRIRLPLCGELQTLLCGRQSGSPQASQHTQEQFLVTLSLIQPVKWLIFGPRRTELTFSKEIIEKQRHGFGSVLRPGTFHSQDLLKITSGMYSHCKICVNFRWFFTILAADHFGIFSYWRIYIMSGAGDNTN